MATNHEVWDPVDPDPDLTATADKQVSVLQLDASSTHLIRRVGHIFPVGLAVLWLGLSTFSAKGLGFNSWSGNQDPKINTYKELKVEN